MNTTSDLETILKHAPRPEPPTGLLAALERQIDLNLVTRRQSRVNRSRDWRRIWMPLAGLAGAAALVLFVVAALWLSTARTLADSLKALAQMRSCHVVERFRSGESQSVIIDASKPAGTYPNYDTEEHPGNPLVEVDHWFQLDPDNPSLPKLLTISSDKDVWQQGNRMLTVDLETGARSLRLVNAPNTILTTLEPLAGLASLPLKEIKPRQEPATTLDPATGLWVGEARAPDPTLPGAEMILRVWLNASNRLPVRIQFLSTGFPQTAPEVLMREYQFSDINAAFPEETFNFDITDQDLAPMGITRAELDAMGNDAVSFDVTGESGAEVAGLVQDNAGTRQIHGVVPFTFVHDQRGDLTFDLRMVDGKRRIFGVRFNNSNLQTVTSHIKGKSSDKMPFSETIWNLD